MANARSAPVLVTGAAGFIGFHLSRALLDRSLAVIGIDNLTSYYDPALKRARLSELDGREGFRFVELDLADREAVARLFADVVPARVVHLAAQAGVRYSLEHPFAYVDSNLVGTMSVVEGCRHAGTGHLVFASTSSVYGGNTKLPFSEQDPVDHPVSLYAATKRANELMVHTYSHLYGLPATELRFFTVYGPWGRPDMAYYSFTAAIRAGRPIRLFNRGPYRATSPTSTTWSRPSYGCSTCCPSRSSAAPPTVLRPPSGSTTSATTRRCSCATSWPSSNAVSTPPPSSRRRRCSRATSRRPSPTSTRLRPPSASHRRPRSPTGSPASPLGTMPITATADPAVIFARENQLRRCRAAGSSRRCCRLSAPRRGRLHRLLRDAFAVTPLSTSASAR